MTTSRANAIFTALMLTCSGVNLVASQAMTNSLFYERQTNANIVGTTATRAPMAEEEHKQIVAFREQKEQAAYQAAYEEETKQRAQQTYAQVWLQATLGPREQSVAKELGAVTQLPSDLIKFIALYAEYKFKGECELLLKGHTGFIAVITILPDGRIASGSGDGTIKIWNTTTRECTLTLQVSEDKSCRLTAFPNALLPWVSCLTVLSDGRLVSASSDGIIKIWNTKTGTCEDLLQGHLDNIKLITTLPNGKLAAADFGGTLKILNIANKTCEFTLEDFADSHTCLTVLPDGRLVSKSGDRPIKIWNTTTGECTLTLEDVFWVSSCLITLPDGRLVSDSRDGIIKIWNTTTGKCDLTLEGHPGKEHEEWIAVITILPDGRIAAGSGDGTIRIWNTTTGKCEHTLKGHRKTIRCLTVLPDGQLASGSDYNETIRVWNTTTEKCKYILRGHTFEIHCLAVLSDGRLVSGSEDADIRIWN